VQSSRYDVDGRDRFVGWILLFVQLAVLAAVFLLPEGKHWTTPAWLSDGARAFSFFGVVVVGIGHVNLESFFARSWRPSEIERVGA
jgi:hypothetical protein